MDDPCVSVKDLCFTYPDGTEAVKHVSFEIGKREIVGIIGRNGSGKTTTVRHLNGLLRPSSGKVCLLGNDIAEKKTAQLASTVGYVFQNPDEQISLSSVEEEIAFGMRNIGLNQDEISKRTTEILQQMRMEAYRTQHPYSLSKVLRKKLAIACVLVMRPELIILDEPTTGQDIVEIKMIMRAIRELSHQGHTIIVVTHDMRLAADYCNRLIVMNAGRVVLDGSPLEIFSKRELPSLAGIEPPQITQVSHQLNGSGTILTVDEMFDELCKRTTQI